LQRNRSRDHSDGGHARLPRHRAPALIGITLGLTTVQALNILRIISLFYLGQWNRTVFEWAHLYVWQALIMLDVLLVFLFWLRWVSRQTHAESSALEAAP
jgi:exosortase H (IPTLxxWG-CTERM-specific)